MAHSTQVIKREFPGKQLNTGLERADPGNWVRNTTTGLDTLTAATSCIRGKPKLKHERKPTRTRTGAGVDPASVLRGYFL